MPKKNPIRTTRLKASDGLFHTLRLHPDGRVFDGELDITEDVNRTAAFLRLGRAPGDWNTPTCLAALILHGIEALLRRPADDQGDIRDLGVWNNLWVRFAANAVVLQTEQDTRKRLRREIREQARRAAPEAPVTP